MDAPARRFFRPRRTADVGCGSGCLYLSWRMAAEADQRDAEGRLYAAFAPGLVT